MALVGMEHDTFTCLYFFRLESVHSARFAPGDLVWHTWNFLVEEMELEEGDWQSNGRRRATQTRHFFDAALVLICSLFFATRTRRCFCHGQNSAGPC